MHYTPRLGTRTSAALGAAVVALALTACSDSGSSEGVSVDSIKIGAYIGESGPIALTARDLQRGWQLAFDEINAAGGVNGRTIELVVRDDQYDPAQAVAVTRDLVQNEEVLAVTGLGSPTTLAVNDFLTSQEIPNLFPVTGAGELYEPPTKWTFISQPTYYAQSYVSAKYGIEERGVTKIGIIGQNDEAGEDVAAGCQQAAEDLGAEIVGRHTFESSATDFTGQLSDLRSKGADAVCIANPLELAGLQLKQANQLGWDPVWLGFTSQADPRIVELAGGDAAEGLIAVSTFRPVTDQDPKVQEFLNAYTDAYGASPSFYSQYGYWAGHLMADALEEAGDEPTRESLREVLLSWAGHEDSTGFSGPLSYSEDQPNGLNSMFVVEVQDGTIVAVSDVEPAPDGM